MIKSSTDFSDFFANGKIEPSIIAMIAGLIPYINGCTKGSWRYFFKKKAKMPVIKTAGRMKQGPAITNPFQLPFLHPMWIDTLSIWRSGSVSIPSYPMCINRSSIGKSVLTMTLSMAEGFGRMVWQLLLPGHSLIFINYRCLLFSWIFRGILRPGVHRLASR